LANRLSSLNRTSVAKANKKVGLWKNKKKKKNYCHCLSVRFIDDNFFFFWRLSRRGLQWKNRQIILPEPQVVRWFIKLNLSLIASYHLTKGLIYFTSSREGEKKNKRSKEYIKENLAKRFFFICKLKSSAGYALYGSSV